MLVGERGEGDGGEAPGLQPVHRRRVDGHRLLGRNVGAVLQVVVLTLLLGLFKKKRTSKWITSRKIAWQALALVDSSKSSHQILHLLPSLINRTK